MYDAKCLGTCQCTDLCRFSVSDIASAGGIGHGPNWVTPGPQRHHLPQNRSSMASLASQRLRWSPHRHSGPRLFLHCHHLPTNHTLHRHMAPDYRIIKRDLMRYGRQFCSDRAATARTKQNTAIVHVHSLTDTRLWVLGHPAVPIRCETYFSSLLRTSTACSVQPRLFCFKKTALLILLQTSTALSTASRIQVHISFGCQVTQLAVKPSEIRHV